MPLGERTFERRVWKSSFLHCFTMHISVNRPFDLIIFGLENAFILIKWWHFLYFVLPPHLFFVEFPGIAATSWRLSAWKISRSYWQQQRWKGPESRRQIWFERWKRQSWKNPRPGGWLWIQSKVWLELYTQNAACSWLHICILLPCAG